MIIDANEQSAYAVVGVPLGFWSSNFVLVSYEWMVMADVTLSAATLGDITLTAATLADVYLEPD